MLVIMTQPPLTARPLSDRDLDLLSFEKLWFEFAGVKEAEVRRRFGLSMTAYWQAVNELIDRPEAEAHDPLTVRRLRRIRASRMRSRTLRPA